MPSKRSPEPRRFRPLNVHIYEPSRAGRAFRAAAALPGNVKRLPADLAGGVSPHPEEDLIFHGGRTIADLTFTNFYLGGAASWQGSDRQNIDGALAAAMSDANLNNVIRQYFDNQAITSTSKPSTILPTPPPTTFSQGDVEKLVRQLKKRGTFKGFDLTSTVFNFILPRGAVLTSDPAASSSKASSGNAKLSIKKTAASPVHPEEDEDSLNGLGGYHGSVHFTSPRATVYYAISVFSEGNNGIDGFGVGWKNVVATLYHELNEARTDADVEDAIKSNDAKFLGWTAQSGNEIGDFPMQEAGSNLSLVMKEVPLADGSGTVPIQLEYSNFVHGPEGPIAAPHPPASKNFVEAGAGQQAAASKGKIKRTAAK